jgi:hypothetical protein
MLRNLLFTTLFIFAGQFLFAQDTIYKMNHEKVMAKIREINPTQIKYVPSEYPNGPVYVINKTDVEKIVFSDGHVEYYHEAKDEEVLLIHPLFVGLNSFDLMFGFITPVGEYYFPKNGVSIKANVSLGLNGIKGSAVPNDNYGSEYTYYNKDKIISTGLGIVFYPGHMKHTVNYFTGFSFEFGRMITKRQYYGGYPYYTYWQTHNDYWLGTGISNGIVIKLSDRVDLGLCATLGMSVKTEKYEYNGDDIINTHYQEMGRLDINLGYRFGKAK